MRDIRILAMYLRTCWSRLGMSICGVAKECKFEVTPRQDIGYHVHYTMSDWDNVFWRRRTGRTAW